MKLLIQRVKNAEVCIEGKVFSSISKGLLVFIGIGQGDTQSNADYLIAKLIKLRLFEDENGKTNLSLKDIQGEILVVSQFTLMANLSKGTRPSFTDAMSPDQAEIVYRGFVQALEESSGLGVQTGKFGADMDVKLTNWGPFTLALEK